MPAVTPPFMGATPRYREATLTFMAAGRGAGSSRTITVETVEGEDAEYGWRKGSGGERKERWKLRAGFMRAPLLPDVDSEIGLA